MIDETNLPENDDEKNETSNSSETPETVPEQSSTESSSEDASPQPGPDPIVEQNVDTPAVETGDPVSGGEPVPTEDAATTNTSLGSTETIGATPSNIVTLKVTGAFTGDVQVEKGTKLEKALKAAGIESAGMTFRNNAGALVTKTSALNDDVVLTSVKTASAG